VLTVELANSYKLNKTSENIQVLHGRGFSPRAVEEMEAGFRPGPSFLLPIISPLISAISVHCYAIEITSTTTRYLDDGYQDEQVLSKLNAC
jgi:hypothetical protein